MSLEELRALIARLDETEVALWGAAWPWPEVGIGQPASGRCADAAAALAGARDALEDVLGDREAAASGGKLVLFGAQP